MIKRVSITSNSILKRAPNLDTRDVDITASMVASCDPFLELVEVAARMCHVRVSVHASRIWEPAHPVWRHVTGTLDILTQLVETVTCLRNISGSVGMLLFSGDYVP